MTDVVIAVPGDLSSRTGGYLYDARVLTELAARRRAATALSLPERLPHPRGDDVREALRRLAAVPRGAALFVDGLAFGVLPPDKLRALGRPLGALVHHPLALETGLSPNLASKLEASERAALEVADVVVATSLTTAGILRERFGVAADKLHVAEPGVEPAPRAAGGANGVCVILTVATVTPRKNHAMLAAALGRLKDHSWRWRIAGSLSRDPALVDALVRQIEAVGIAERTDLLGEIGSAALAAEYDRADLFALPSRFEGYGMAYVEALARGLPVISGVGGASAATVPHAAGAVVDADDSEAIEAALRRLIGDPVARRAASDAAWDHARTLSRWTATADVFEAAAARLA
ncbi:glycosyltransferase family 4 protein [Methylopila turkensis]|uniref:Glycosyl transferase n=1 Tax=Methylopila turkensis TaxID=1437816 RepID=A0A9W6JNK7_9HYPH|nr:glycosyltransferase family 4 protein [Methylopila turkensis]GLK80392.1 glycosyl transferase [Methylopila turkensis]